MEQDFYQRLLTILDQEDILLDEPMSRHTTFRIGGPADYFVIPRSVQALAGVIALCRKTQMPYYILGNGSNLLVGDKGYRGVMIQLFKEWSQITVGEETITAQAGAVLSRVANEASEHGLTGFEFASGIPGTIGGAVVMNAGAYGGEMKDVIAQASVLTPEGDIKILTNEKLELGYRTSIVAREGYVVLEVTIALASGQPEEIRARLEELKEKRNTKQPLEYPSAGSTFKRPEGYFAGKLISDAGLRGFTVGGAQVSEKHCGFVINIGKATAKDVVSLMEQVKQQVYEQFAVELTPEVKMIGEF